MDHTMAAREFIHTLQRDIKAFRAVITSVYGRDIDGLFMAMFVSVRELPTCATIRRVPGRYMRRSSDAREGRKGTKGGMTGSDEAVFTVRASNAFEGLVALVINGIVRYRVFHRVRDHGNNKAKYGDDN